MNPLRSRLPAVGTTIFTVMSRLAAEVGAINLSQGFPGFRLRSRRSIEAVARHMREGRNQYAPMPGVLALREAIAAMYRSAHGRSVRSRDRNHDHLRRDRSDLRRRDGAACTRATRSSCSSRATTRTSRPSCSAAACRSPCRCGSRNTRWTGMRCARAITAADAAAADQHAAQPDRGGALGRGHLRTLAAIVDGTEVIVLAATRCTSTSSSTA